jgi:hypothetical protein
VVLPVPTEQQLTALRPSSMRRRSDLGDWRSPARRLRRVALHRRPRCLARAKVDEQRLGHGAPASYRRSLGAELPDARDGLCR